MRVLLDASLAFHSGAINKAQYRNVLVGDEIQQTDGGDGTCKIKLTTLSVRP